MPDITDPTLITWVNETLRPLADETSDLYFRWEKFLAEYDYLDGFPATTDAIIDGAASDGRTELVSQDVRGFRGIINSMALVVNTDALDLEKLIRPAVNYDDTPA